ncbi:MAG: nitroreductase family protein [Candidatus Sumerlaeia bacterium]
MSIQELVKKNRSYRRFDESVAISEESLRELVDLARCSASSANQQPLKFKIFHEPEMNARIFQFVSWAGYLTEWKGPEEGERPTAYIAILGDRTIKKQFGIDPGIAAQSMLLGAVEKGLGGCMMGAINRDELSKLFQLGDRYELLLMIALGKPVEDVRLASLPEDGSIKYWRDEAGVHYVPKRDLDDLII